MEIIQALILSIIEGITEFLPVSSTGHLLLATNFLKIPQTEFVKSFEVIIQLGAILAVVVLYWKQLSHNFAIYRNIVIAFIPSAIVGLVLYDFIKEVLFENILITVGALLIGGGGGTVDPRLSMRPGLCLHPLRDAGRVIRLRES